MVAIKYPEVERVNAESFTYEFDGLVRVNVSGRTVEVAISLEANWSATVKTLEKGGKKLIGLTVISHKVKTFHPETNSELDIRYGVGVLWEFIKKRITDFDII